MTRQDSPSRGFFRLLLGIWIAWLLVAPRAGYIFAAIGLFLTLGYAIHTNTRRSIHDLMAWPTSNQRPSFFLGALLFVGISLGWPFVLPSKKPNHDNPSAPSAKNNTTHTPQDPQSPHHSSPAKVSGIQGPRVPQGQRTTPTSPRSTAKRSVVALNQGPSPTTPPQPRTSRRVEAIRQALAQLEEFQKIGQEQQQLRVRIQQGDPLAKNECQSRFKSLQNSIQTYQKRVDTMPDEVAMHARAAGQQLETCLGCGFAIDGKTYCEQMKAFKLDAQKAFKKLY